MTSSRIVGFAVLFLSGACCFCAAAGAQTQAQAPMPAGNPGGLQYGQESSQIAADRKALADAKASGDSARILAAKERLSDDLVAQQPKPPKKVKPAKKKRPADQTTAGKSSDLIKADEKALQEAQASGDPAKIKAAQDKLNADQQQAQPVVHNKKFNELKHDWKFKPVTSP